MLLCDACDKGFHMECLGIPRLPSDNHGELWLCDECRHAGLRINVDLPNGKTRYSTTNHDATILVKKPNGSVKLKTDNGEEYTDVLLDKLRWHAFHSSTTSFRLPDMQTTSSDSIAATCIMASMDLVQLTNADMFDRPPKSIKEALAPDNKLRATARLL